MAKKSNDYWKRRFETMEDSQYQKSQDYYETVKEQFRQAQNDIQMDMERWYDRLAKNNDVSLAGAKKLLKKNELNEFQWNVNRYIKAGEENAVDQRWMKELENASAKYHVNYLQAMKMQMQQHVEKLFTEYEGGTTEFLYKTFGDQYKHTAYEIAKGTGIGSNLTQLDTRKIDTLVKKPWAADGANYSDRIWANKQKLTNTLNTELTQSIIRGDDPAKAIKNLSQTMDVSRSQAGRLIMTESAAISSAAQKECFKDLDVEDYEIVATLDSHTSEICRGLDGKVFQMSEYEVGVTAPPFHPFCRTTTVPYFEDNETTRAARGESGKTTYVDGKITYEEWEKQYEQGEKEESPRKQTEGTYGVNWPEVQSSEYREKLTQLSENPKVVDSIHTRIKWALNNRDGLNTEELYALNLDTGEEIARIANQQYQGGVKRTKNFAERLEQADKEKVNVLLMHNHPKGLPPSLSDINLLLESEHVTGITAGHDGSIYFYSRPKKLIEISDWNIALKHNMMYSEITSMEKALEELSEEFGFVFKKL